jgi:hypothetical protein
LAQIQKPRRNCFLFCLPQSKNQTLKQNHTVLCRATLSGPERAPDSARWGHLAYHMQSWDSEGEMQQGVSYVHSLRNRGILGLSRHNIPETLKE